MGEAEERAWKEWSDREAAAVEGRMNGRVASERRRVAGRVQGRGAMKMVAARDVQHLAAILCIIILAAVLDCIDCSNEGGRRTVGRTAEVWE
jgi:hypothetical protein